MKLSSPRAAKALNQELTKLKTGIWLALLVLFTTIHQFCILKKSAKQTKTLQYWLKLFYKTYSH